MNTTTRTSIIYVLEMSQVEAQEAIQDPALVIRALKYALTTRASLDPDHRNGHRSPKARRDKVSCACGRKFDPKGLGKHQATCPQALAAALQPAPAAVS